MDDKVHKTQGKLWTKRLWALLLSGVLLLQPLSQVVLAEGSMAQSAQEDLGEQGASAEVENAEGILEDKEDAGISGDIEASGKTEVPDEDAALEEAILIDETLFPDENLRREVLEKLDLDKDGSLSLTERDETIELDISNKDIFSLKGLEIFTRLQKLDCSGNHLKKSDMEPFVSLEELEFRNNSYIAMTEKEVTEELEALEEAEAVPLMRWQQKENFTFVSTLSQELIGEVVIDKETFPDPAFQNYIAVRYDENEDGRLSEEEIRAVTSLYVKNLEIKDLTGVDIFQNLVFLDCSENLLTELDLKELKQLRGVYCKENAIFQIDISGNSYLKQLECDATVQVVDKEEEKDEIEGGIPPEGELTQGKTQPPEDVIYQVSFKSNGGSSVKEQRVPHGGRAKIPASPKKAGYLFAGWYQGTVKYDFNKEVTGDLVLQGTWSKVTVGKTSLTKVSNSEKSILYVSYNKVHDASGYDVQSALSKDFKSGLKRYFTTAASRKFSKMYKGKTYYIRVRAYKYDSKKEKVYGTFTPVRAVKITNGIQLVAPSSNAVSLKSVSLVSSTAISIQASAPNEVKSVDDYYYLFNLTATETGFPSTRKPLGKVSKKSTGLNFQIPLYYNSKNSRLHRRFAVGVRVGKSPDRYQLVTQKKFISNPERLARYTYGFPKASTKKGLQVNEFYISDAVSLGVKNTTYNMCLDDMIALPGRRNNTYGISFRYDGATYWFDRGVIQSYDRTLNEYKRNKMVVSAIILLRYRSDLTYLMPAGGRYYRDGFYGLNTASNEARKQLEATFTFLAKRYASDGRIANWIIGNEVNNYGTYHYTGSSSLSHNVRIYTDAFRLAYISIRSVYSNARLYISLDHLWNTIVAGGHGSKQFLDKFGEYWNSYGNFNIAYHPYPSPLTAPEFWKNYNGTISNSSNSACITMGNIRVLTQYVKSRYGSKTRIILSEQGFTSRKYGTSVEKTQAAAIAYGYYLAEFNDMIDAFILHRHIDHQVEVNQGLALGLWTNAPGTYETKGRKKYGWEVYKYMDTRQGAKKTAFALPIIGTVKWNLVVPGYNAARFS